MSEEGLILSCGALLGDTQHYPEEKVLSYGDGEHVLNNMSCGLTWGVGVLSVKMTLRAALSPVAGAPGDTRIISNGQWPKLGRTEFNRSKI